MKYSILKKSLFFLIFPLSVFSQEENKIIDPNGKWFFGAEIGRNEITSFRFGEPSTSLQGGVLVEYYTGKHWSLTGRVKYFKTGVSFYTPNTEDESFEIFNGEVISIPINIKWEFSIIKNLSGYLKTGFAHNSETKSDYIFTSYQNPNFPKKYSNFNTGLGLTYNISNKTTFYFDIESYNLGGLKGSSGGWFFPKNYYTDNALLNFGIKINFKNLKK